MKVYISGVTALFDQQQIIRYRNAETLLTKSGHSVISPLQFVNLEKANSDAEIRGLVNCRMRLEYCDAIYLLDPPEDSYSGKLEMETANRKGLQVLKNEKDLFVD